MQRFRRAAITFLCLIGGAAGAIIHASDPVAVYARVDRVVFAPSPEAPKTIQVFGVFSMASPDDPNSYRPPAAGYLYFTTGVDEKLARREWADLKAIAGTKQIVAFGSRYRFKPQLREATAAPDKPDTYSATGLTKVNATTDYAPIRGLVDYRH